MKLRSRTLSEDQLVPMPATLKIADLHEAYHGASVADCIAMANLGAICWSTFKDGLYDQWAQSMTADESARAAAYREEGRQEGRLGMLETMKAKLAAAEEMSARLAAAEGTVAQLRASIEAETARRVGDALEGFRKDYELSKVKEMTALQQRIAAAEAREEMLVLVREGQAIMKEKLAALEEERAALQSQLLEATAAKTNSSHVIGKQGEATVWEMIETNVLQEFPYAEAKNMSGVVHAADFHLWVMGPSGKRIKILIDSKKYKRPVNSDEINKLCADVDSDDDARAGLLVSLISPICTTKQFQIKTTDKGKPILYISFHDIDDTKHSKILCWGIRALLAAVHDTKEDINVEVARTEELLNDISTSLKEVDSMVKTHLKMVEGLRAMKHTILHKISDYQNNGNDDGEENHSSIGCTTVVKATGLRCSKPTFNGGTKCRHHTSRKEKGGPAAEADVVCGGGDGGN